MVFVSWKYHPIYVVLWYKLYIGKLKKPLGCQSRVEWYIFLFKRNILKLCLGRVRAPIGWYTRRFGGAVRSTVVLKILYVQSSTTSYTEKIQHAIVLFVCSYFVSCSLSHLLYHNYYKKRGDLQIQFFTYGLSLWWTVASYRERESLQDSRLSPL